ncbi:MAG: hypothetical protein EOM12_05995 [Verrucomicrobiae bacterium]|nr:hypothetical protein [Verrucomicrobiae bacterium]
MCILLSLFFIFVFIPLLDRNKRLEAEVQESYKDLMELNRNSPYLVGTNASSVETNLVEIKPRINLLRQAYLRQIKLLRLPKEIQKRVHDPFQTFEFILARNELSSALDAKAKEKKVSLDPSVLTGLPEYHYGMPDPQLLWTRLQACDRVLNSLIDVGPTLIQSFSLQPDKEYYRVPDEAATAQNQVKASAPNRGPNASSQADITNQPPQEVLFLEIPVHVRFVGSMESVLGFLRDFDGSIPPSMEKEMEAEMGGQAIKTNNPPASAPAPVAQKEVVVAKDASLPSEGQTGAAEGVQPPAAKKDGEAGPEVQAKPPVVNPPDKDAAEKTSLEENKEETVFKNSLFLGPFELHISPDNPDHVVLTAIVSSVFSLLPEVKK